MTTYICKCGRRVKKSTDASTTGNRLSGYAPGHECWGCPYAMPYGNYQWDESARTVSRETQGYECRMSKTLTYASEFAGSIKDKYKIYDNKSDVITPVGEKLTAEQWLDRYQWGRYTKMIVGGGIINGSVALVFDDEMERYRKAGCDFSACVTDEDYLAAIEAFEDDPPMADAGVSDQTRIADALEDMVALSLPDDTTNTTEE